MDRSIDNDSVRPSDEDGADRKSLQDIGWRLKVLRQNLRVSQESLGARIGVSYQTIQRYERGQYRIAADRLEAIARILGVPVGYFFGESEEARGRPYDRTALAIAAEAERLPSDRIRKSAYRFMKTINAEWTQKTEGEKS